MRHYTIWDFTLKNETFCHLDFILFVWSCVNTVSQNKQQRVEEGNTDNVHVTKVKWIFKTGGIKGAPWATIKRTFSFAFNSTRRSDTTWLHPRSFPNQLTECIRMKREDHLSLIAASLKQSVAFPYNIWWHDRDSVFSNTSKYVDYSKGPVKSVKSQSVKKEVKYLTPVFRDGMF